MMAAWTLWFLLMCTALTRQGSEAMDCGMAPLNTRIVGGENATAGAWPWMVSMHINFASLYICGGTLISDQWVLTAAHCIILNFPSVWILYFGRETQSGPNVNEVNRTVSQIIIHPDFNNKPFNNDIALMKLSSPVTFNDYIRPVCLASNSSGFHNSTPCWATGWGSGNRTDHKYDKNLLVHSSISLPHYLLLGNYTSPGTEWSEAVEHFYGYFSTRKKNLPKGTGPLFDALQEVQVPVIGANQCSCSYQADVNITDQMICAGEENKGICLGDGGGPLQCKQNTRWIQAGVTNFGRLCAPANFPEVYARVSEFQDWIMEQVAGSNVSFVTFTSSGTDPDDSFVCPSLNATTAAPNMTAPVIPALNSTSPPTTSSAPSTVADKLGLIVILVTVLLQHIVVT